MMTFILGIRSALFLGWIDVIFRIISLLVFIESTLFLPPNVFPVKVVPLRWLVLALFLLSL